MNQLLLRAAACAGICASLTGCAGSLGRAGAAMLASAAVHTVAAAAATVASAASKNENEHAHAHTSAPVAASRTPVYPDREDPALLTCDAKRREFLSVYGGVRRLPPQLRCTEDGEFGSPIVYSSGRSKDAAALASEEPADEAL